MAERQFGPYRLVRQIAVGGMAEIHLAKTKGIAGFEKYVALKMIHPNFAEDDQFIQMLVDEAKIAVQLTHGNIAQTFDLGRVGDTYYITMEYVDGADLYKILRKASEVDIEMPLDVCAFVGKEIASALDHAHRKRDNFGKTLGIVHRDVSPQNVLISYAGEVKLVDFGIAKATMKARQTAVGVIKGKYYYMSPEQAWGDPIDYRSDIFSAGIVLYEMITGQMLYLEEDLHKLLDMARKAEIAPPSRLRKGVPPQLERIVMHALAKGQGERYQSAGDFASDLERFLHTYSPVFTAGKIAQLIKRVVGEPIQVPNHDGGNVRDPSMPSIEIRDGVMSTHELAAAELEIQPEDIRDENSVIFRMDELSGKPQPVQQSAPAPAAKPAGKPQKAVLRAETRQAPLEPPTPQPVAPQPANNRGQKIAVAQGKIPSVNKPAVAAKPQPRPSRPRAMDEETRQIGLDGRPGAPESGLLRVEAQKWNATLTEPGSDTSDDDLENIGERTIITGNPTGGGYMMDAVDGDGPVEATLITSAPQGPTDTSPDLDSPFENDATAEQISQVGRTADRTDDEELSDDDEGPTLSRDFVPPAVVKARKPKPAAAPPALAAKIHAPAVSELRRPKPSRRTPPGGVPAQGGNVLQQIVGAQSSEPMPTPRPDHRPPPMPPMQMQMQAPPPQPMPPQQFPTATPASQPQYDASGLPLGIPTPPPGVPIQSVPGVPPHLQPYVHMQGYPPAAQYMQQPGHPAYPVMPPQYPGQQQPMSPNALYGQNWYGQQPQQPLSLTGQMRLYEVDELPSAYKLGESRRRWITYTIRVLILAVIAGAAFIVVKRITDKPETTVAETGSVRIDSVPQGAEVIFDDTLMTAKTPLTVEGIPVGTRHEVRLKLPRFQQHKEFVDIPKQGGEISISPQLVKLVGKIQINTRPPGAEIRINDQLRGGRTPVTLNDIDLDSAKKIELRLKDYQPHSQDLVWPADGVISIDVQLKR